MSIKKIAERVGVSPATVSRVLNNPNYHCSSEKVRDQIWKVAMELKYVPNQAARNLKLGVQNTEEKTYYINVLMTRTNNSRTDPFFSELLRVIESEIHKHLCILSKVWYMPEFSDDSKCRNMDLDKLIANLHEEEEEKCDGLIVIGKSNQNVLKKLKKQFKNIILINRNPTNFSIDEIFCDGKKLACTAVEYLISLGHENIGYVGECRNESRYRGYIETLQKHNIDLKPAYVLETKQTEAGGFAAMEKLLQSEDCPTGIYCANDITAIGMLKYLGKRRKLYFAPSIIASDDIDEAQYIKPMLTTISIPKEEMGRFALYLLLDRIRGRHGRTVRMELSGKLMIRSSCKRIGESEWNDYVI